MKISYKGDYAIKALVLLSTKYDPNNVDSYCQLSEISKTQDIPLKFLEQILLILRNAGYIRSRRGANGGYALAKAPATITLGEIIRLTDGSTAPIACVSKSCYQYCNFEKKCVLKPIWEEVREKISDVIDNITFFDLSMKQKVIDETVQNKEMYFI
ncbi:MAG: Rrf2 family transcriptional regulator [bacterium]